MHIREQSNQNKEQKSLNASEVDQYVLWEEALASEDVEVVSRELELLKRYQEFRKQTSNFPVPSFVRLIETLSLAHGQKNLQEVSEKAIIDFSNRSSAWSPRVADFFSGVIARYRNEEHRFVFENVQKKIAELEASGDWDILFGRSEMELKANRLETRVAGFLRGIHALDRVEWRSNKAVDAEYPQESNASAPKRRDSSQPGVDPMERSREGEQGPAIWNIAPGWSGYYREQVFGEWDESSCRWTEPEGYRYTPVPLGSIDYKSFVPQSSKERVVTMKAQIGVQGDISLPVPYTHTVAALESSNAEHLEVLVDQHQNYIIRNKGLRGGEVGVVLVPKKRHFHDQPVTAELNFLKNFTEETTALLEKLSRSHSLQIDKALALARYVRQRITYLAPADQQESQKFNDLYRSHPKGFAYAVDEVCQADCDVANTYYAALCSALKIPVRHVVGHSVPRGSKTGDSAITYSTGHGWSEVWNNLTQQWQRVDATPPGDPNLDEQGDGAEQIAIPGDTDAAETEIQVKTDEELAELAARLKEREVLLGYTKEERYLAEATGVSLSEARSIQRELDAAERLQLPNGERISDVLAKLFQQIIESRKIPQAAYEGPVRRTDGGEQIENIVRHAIGIRAHELDPVSRAKPATEEAREPVAGGFDVYMIGDKSGSMRGGVNETQTLLEMQRSTMYLILTALHRFQTNIEKAHLTKDQTLQVRSEAISFTDDNSVDIDKPLSGVFSPKDKVTLWNSLSQIGGGNGDLSALHKVYEQIMEEDTAVGKNDTRLRLIIACSDGGYVGSEGQMRSLAEELSRHNALVVGIGLTETAASVPITLHNPPYSYGTVVRDMESLPQVVAGYVVQEMVKLLPGALRSQAQEGLKELIKGLAHRQE